MLNSINSSFSPVPGTGKMAFQTLRPNEINTDEGTFFSAGTAPQLHRENTTRSENVKPDKLLDRIKVKLTRSAQALSNKLKGIKLIKTWSGQEANLKPLLNKRLLKSSSGNKYKHLTNPTRRKKGILQFIFRTRGKSRNDNKKAVSGKDKKIKFYKLYWQMIYIIESQSLYLDPEIKQRDIIKYLGTNRNYTYMALSLYGDTNFKGLLNRYRINHFKSLIKKEIKSGRNFILSEYYSQCGFRTNESFYRTFRKQEGITPGEYLRRLNYY